MAEEIKELNIAILKKTAISRLQKLAREMGVNGVSGLTKEDLIYRIMQAQAEKKRTAFWRRGS